MPSLADVESQLTKLAPKYRAVAEVIRSSCEQIARERGEGFVRQIYGRADKQKGLELNNKDFKSPLKIAIALNRLKRDKITDVHDVCGLTVVLHYSDQIAPFVAELTQILQLKRIKQISNKERKTGGYYATHIVFVSDHADHRKIACEVQVKTMLHDAWAAKTHDLTYKPLGQNDPRLDKMMNMFADSLQAIEAQSEMLRDIIEERWTAENGWRQALRSSLFEFLPIWMDEGVHSDLGKALRESITNNKDYLAKADDNDDRLQNIAAQIDDLCESSLREGYFLEVYMSIVRNRPKERARALERALQWLDIADQECLENRARPHEVWSVPLIFYVCADLGGAISAAEKLDAGKSLHGRDREVLRFNLANHLIENAYFRLPENIVERDDLEKRIRSLIASAATLRADDPTPFFDAEGMLVVAFSQNPKEVRESIDLIEQGNQNVPEEDANAASNYYELHARLAWRRLFELETKITRERHRQGVVAPVV